MFKKFFYGRYGVDNLTLTMILLAAILINIKYVWIIGAGLTGYAIFRTISKDINKRRLELQKFDKATYGIRKQLAPLNTALVNGSVTVYKKVVSYKTRFKQRKEYVFIKCTKCKNTLRLPRNKGKLSVTCPVCKTEFIKKT